MGIQGPKSFVGSKGEMGMCGSKGVTESHGPQHMGLKELKDGGKGDKGKKKCLSTPCTIQRYLQ